MKLKRYEVRLSSWFDTHPYDINVIKAIMSNVPQVSNIRTARHLGLFSQPRVVTFSMPEDLALEIEATKLLQIAFKTEWVGIARR